MHVDVCEQLWDQPRAYTEGWGWRLAYCIAFSTDGATDVTRRYTRNPVRHGTPRSRGSEEAFLWTISEIRNIRRESMSAGERDRLAREDQLEEHELITSLVYALSSEIVALRRPNVSRHGNNDQRIPELGDGPLDTLENHSRNER